MAQAIKAALELDLSQLQAKLLEGEQKEAVTSARVARTQAVIDKVKAQAVATDAIVGRVREKLTTVGKGFAKFAALELGSSLIQDFIPDNDTDASFIAGQFLNLGTSIGFGALAGGPLGAALGALAGTASVIKASINRMEQQQKQLEKKIEEQERRARQIDDNFKTFYRDLEEKLFKEGEKRMEEGIAEAAEGNYQFLRAIAAMN